MCLTHRCALRKCSQQTAPTRFPGKAPQTLQVGSIDMDGGPISWSQISRTKRYPFSIHPTAVALFWEEWCSLIGQCIEILKPTHLGMDTRCFHGELGITSFCGNAFVEICVQAVNLFTYSGHLLTIFICSTAQLNYWGFFLSSVPDV